MTTALGLSLATALPLLAEEAAPAQDQAAVTTDAVAVDSGAYLAGRNAEARGDFRAALGWFTQALSLDPGNDQIIDGATFASLVLGHISEAAGLAATRSSEGAAEGDLQISQYARLADAALREDYPALTAQLESGPNIGPLVDGLALAWSRLGEGDMSAAVKQFETVGKMRGLEPYGVYHKALALALAGDFEGSEKIFSGLSGLDPRGVLIRAQVLSQIGQPGEAKAVLDATWPPGSEPVADAMREQLAAGEPLPFDLITSPREGLAEVFYSLATLLANEADPAYTLLNTRIAEALNPRHDHAVLLGAAMLEGLGEYDLAEEAYAKFPPDHPAYYNAQLGRAAALYAAGRKEAAIEALKALTRSHGDLIVVQAALGDTLRREERWAEAAAAYDAAAALLPEKPNSGVWVLYFSRAITKERRGLYEEADLDFRRAMELNPRQPEVLNYLGYSLIERGTNLDEALELINKAVAIEPESGYIVDSLAWAYFTLGRYSDALEPMERASVLEPVDPVVTDHLGDVYWMNGRKREAEFQWHRALSYGPEEKEALRIRKKLEIGLDAVLAAEGATPAPASESNAAPVSE
ncbi:tetratricopeptide repeat protein [Pseudogemmobacter sp. CC-YST710]|uniref:Tetratricopeptide repeat protein n=2 Tax=Pseudogemmobacter faecipullorum TaxID=2755041 RepID=A0ABS8CJ93_9RHOB|nr:tetratricopeptide repeat protein [Pseudogemmobacter faecipullorum]